MDVLLIIIILVYSIIGFVVLINWITDGSFEGVSTPRRYLAFLICGPFAWVLFFGAAVYRFGEKYILKE